MYYWIIKTNMIGNVEQTLMRINILILALGGDPCVLAVH